MAEYQEFRSIMDGINTSLQRCERHEQQILSEIEVKKADIEKAYAPKLERVRIEKARLEQQRKDEMQIYSQSLGGAVPEDETAVASKEHDAPISQSTRATKSTERPNGRRSTFLATPETASTPTSQVQSSRPFKPFSMISEDFPTIVRSADNDGWVELRCILCGTNMKHKWGVLLRGAVGFTFHLARTHEGSSPTGPAQKWSIPDVVEQCVYHRLSEAEAQGILDGKRGAYRVPKVTPNQKKSAGSEDEEDEQDGDDDDRSMDNDNAYKPNPKRNSLSRSNHIFKPNDGVNRAARKSAPSLPNKRGLELEEAETSSRKEAKMGEPEGDAGTDSPTAVTADWLNDLLNGEM